MEKYHDVNKNSSKIKETPNGYSDPCQNTEVQVVL